jgi:LytS/YehU family sensor histidine kinase
MKKKINMIVEETENVTLYIGSYVRYLINSKENYIIAYSDEINNINSTILNLPFAIFCANKGIFLLYH